MSPSSPDIWSNINHLKTSIGALEMQIARSEGNVTWACNRLSFIRQYLTGEWKPYTGPDSVPFDLVKVIDETLKQLNGER